MVERRMYHDRIAPFVNVPIVKAITGMRRSGKSTFMLQLIERLRSTSVGDENIVYLNMELFEHSELRSATALHGFISAKAAGRSGKMYIFIDEVQEVSGWERVINSLLAENNYDIYITGSNAHLLSSELATLLSGRYVELRIHTLSLPEQLELTQLKYPNRTATEQFAYYLRYGGFPGLHYLPENDGVIRQFLEAMYSTIVLNDLITRHALRDPDLFQRVMLYLADNCGNLTSAKRIADFLKAEQRKVAVDTVMNYIHFAQSAFLIERAQRYDVQGRRVLEVNDKYFMSDLGLRFAMRGYTPTMQSGQLENAVYLELIRRGYTVHVGKTNGGEIDFVAHRGDDKRYYQVTSTLNDPKVIDREYGAFNSINDHFPKTVLSLDAHFDTNYNGINWQNIQHFLMGNNEQAN
jgi:predicted AAA+ superfamily ATPase